MIRMTSRIRPKEALNWSITAGCAYVLALFLMIIVIGAFLVPVIGVTHIVFCIMGAVAASMATPSACRSLSAW